MSLEAIIFYLFLLDSIFANIMVWFGARWYNRNLGLFTRYFPASKGWSTLYLILVLWIGFLLARMGIL
jgi:hypothetical protein